MLNVWHFFASGSFCISEKHKGKNSKIAFSSHSYKSSDLFVAHHFYNVKNAFANG